MESPPSLYLILKYTLWSYCIFIGNREIVSLLDGVCEIDSNRMSSIGVENVSVVFSIVVL